MRIILKRIFVTCLSSVLILSCFSNICSAKELSKDNANSISPSIHLMSPSSGQSSLLREQNIDPNTVVIVDKNEIFPEVTLQHMEKEDKELASQGMIKKCEVFFIEKSSLTSPNQKKMNPNLLSATSPSWDYQVNNIRQYVDVTDLSSPSQGLAYWVDLAFNIVVDSVSIKWLTAASILGVSGSSFLPYYVSGDRLIKTENRTFNDTYYMWYDKNQTAWPLVRTTFLSNDVYIDLYQANSTRLTDHTLVFASTQHRSAYAWIYSECAANTFFNGLVCTYDRY